MSDKITEILTPEGEVIYIQYDEADSDELIAVAVNPIVDIQERSDRLRVEIAKTVRGYSRMILDTVKDSTEQLQPSKITLQFGIQAGGETGIPFVTKGTAQANVTVTIEWTLNASTKPSRDAPG
jgi:hypothetical protein